jgi:nonsense-mediated mRNA decay protein 3
MAKSFCPKCGSDADVFYDNVCMQCFIGNKKLLGSPQIVYGRICPTCGSVFRRGRWQFGGKEEDTVNSFVKENLELNRDANSVELALTSKQLDYSRYMVHVEAKGEIKGAPIDAVMDTEVRISWETCDTCSRISGGYFEGIVQIRADKRLPTPEELKRCVAIAEGVAARSQEKGDKLAFVARTEELPEGIDIYVGLIKLGRQICRAVIDTFGGKITESPKLIGQKNGVDLYRITYALRLPEFVRGDIISVDGTVIEVRGCGKHVSGIDLETGKRFMENFNDLMDVKKLSRRDDAVSAVLVADEGRTIQVLDPHTYETVTVKRPEFLSVEPGNEIKIVKTEKGIFVLP